MMSISSKNIFDRDSTNSLLNFIEFTSLKNDGLFCIPSFLNKKILISYLKFANKGKFNNQKN